jgi:hypothetical protein
MLVVYYEDVGIRTPGMHFTLRYREACALHISGHFYFPYRISANFGELRHGEVLRIPLPRTSVNKDKKRKGRTDSSSRALRDAG